MALTEIIGEYRGWFCEDPAARSCDTVAKGATYVFAALGREHEAVRTNDPRCKRTIVVPPDWEALRDMQLTTLYAHPWKVELSTAQTTRVFA